MAIPDQIVTRLRGATVALTTALVVIAAGGCGVFGDNRPRAVQTYGNDAAIVAEATQPPDSTTAPTEPNADGGSGDDATSDPADPDSPSPDSADVVTARPAWLGTRTLPTTQDGTVTPQTTPEELVDRRLATIDLLPPPADDGLFRSTIEPLTADTIARSTLAEGCPVGAGELRYLTLSFWGFDNRPHTGEMIVNAAVAEDIVSVFRTLFDAQFPIEEMRLVTKADLDAPPTGDGNNTASFVCRPVTGGTRFSQHAYGLAVDINPFHNPYHRGEVVLPELATVYLDRSGVPGMIVEGDVAVTAFEAIGWHWGGWWTSLKDYQHFSSNNR